MMGDAANWSRCVREQLRGLLDIVGRQSQIEELTLSGPVGYLAPGSRVDPPSRAQRQSTESRDPNGHI